MQKIGLFGLTNTNKDFQNTKTWGKNQFNNTFPTALACYMASKGLRPVYLCLNNERTDEMQRTHNTAREEICGA